jgi:hypothetical protein
MIKRLLLWLEYRKHPCYIGSGEFDHDWEFVDDSFDHEYGVEFIHFERCLVCGEMRDCDNE